MSSSVTIRYNSKHGVIHGGGFLRIRGETFETSGFGLRKQ